MGKEVASKYKGVIKDESEHIRVLEQICSFFKIYNLFCHGLTKSPIKGKKGNVEYLGYFKKGVNKSKIINIADIVKK